MAAVGKWPRCRVSSISRRSRSRRLAASLRYSRVPSTISVLALWKKGSEGTSGAYAVAGMARPQALLLGLKITAWCCGEDIDTEQCRSTLAPVEYQQGQRAADQPPEGGADAQQRHAGGGDHEGDQGGIPLGWHLHGLGQAVADGTEQG